MKVAIYCAEAHNQHIFKEKNKDGTFDFVFIPEVLTMDTISLCEGCDGILINTLCVLTEPICHKLQEQGVLYIASRAAGTNHMNIDFLNKYGLKACNVPSYSPNAISELTILLLLNLLRHMKEVQTGINHLDFTTDNVCGKELRSMTVGLIGCGNIGLETIRILNGFESTVKVLNCRLEKIDNQIQQVLRPAKETIQQYASYASLEEIQQTCDVIICHMPLSDATYHLIDSNFINQCKDGVLLINAARGGIFHTSDILTGLENGKIGGFGFDVYEDEERFICQKSNMDTFQDGVIEKLCARNNVVFTPHIGYYTQEALRAMIEISLDNLNEMYLGNNCKNIINQ